MLRWLMSDTFGVEDDTPDVPSWMAQAACAGRDQTEWFPARGDSYTEARATCEGCEVRADCLAHALDVEGDAGPTHRFGLWGGLSPVERARLASSAA